VLHRVLQRVGRIDHADKFFSYRDRVVIRRVSLARELPEIGANFKLDAKQLRVTADG